MTLRFAQQLTWIIASFALAAPTASSAPAPVRPAKPQEPTSGSTPASSAATYRAVLDQYCVTCHNKKLKTAGLVLENLDLNRTVEYADVFEKVIRKIRVGMMPPQGVPKPDAETRRNLIAWLETTLDHAVAAKPNPGRPLVHRLNRAEYANVIRDLLALDVDTASLLPPDDSGYGFDNIADVLGVSPVLLERYLSAAGKISALAVGDPTTGPAGETFRVRQDASQDVHIEGLPLGTVGGLLAKVTLPLDGEYVLQTKLYRTNLGAMRGLEYPHQLEITVDGARVHLASFGGEADFNASMENVTAAGDAIDARFTKRLQLKAGPHQIAVAFLYRGATSDTLRLQPFIRSSNDTLDPSGHPHIDTFTVTGPFNPSGPGDTPSRRKIFTCRPGSTAEEELCAKKIVGTLARQAYRGTETPADLQRLMEFYQAGRRGGTFDSGIQLALQRILASPKFVFRTERDPENVAEGGIYRVSDLELASRLSFFLWSSIPDEQLLDMARQGKLRNPAVLSQQVRRMLADPKAEALVQNFAGQWLYLRNLRAMIPNSLDFPDFDDNLRFAFQRETELFFGSILREDRSVLDLMTADYTFVNERLAKHYGIPNVYGSHFRRVNIPGNERRGLLGQGSILMVTSHTDRTSPVVRGKWVLDNLLGAPPPPPPANVPPLDEKNLVGGRVLTMRERMEAHRSNPYCASCHKLMDPIGFSLENFDAVGAWRTREGGTGGTPIDASGQLLDGTSINGPVELRKALLAQPEIFAGTLAEKLMTYALGRGLTAYDMPVVRSIIRDAAKQNYRFSSFLMGIINSTPFQMRIKAADSASSIADASSAAQNVTSRERIAGAQKR
jgi:mono/diheme cytochrome c family protein